VLESTPRAGVRVKMEKKLALGGFTRKEVCWRKAHRKQKAGTTVVRERKRSEPD
jgi:hypothetical protein